MSVREIQVSKIDCWAGVIRRRAATAPVHLGSGLQEVPGCFTKYAINQRMDACQTTLTEDLDGNILIQGSITE